MKLYRVVELQADRTISTKSVCARSYTTNPLAPTFATSSKYSLPATELTKMIRTYGQAAPIALAVSRPDGAAICKSTIATSGGR